jgi:predicted RNA-binding protein YlxR (DUF448 family)
MMLGDGGAGFGPAAGRAGANLLPPGYTDKSLVRIPIRMSDIEPNKEVQPEKKKKNVFKRFTHAMTPAPDGDAEIKVVGMCRGDYLKYWAKGEDGKFLPTVVEPPEGRKAWVENQLKLNEEWNRQDRLAAQQNKQPEKTWKGIPIPSKQDVLMGGTRIGKDDTAFRVGLN